MFADKAIHVGNGDLSIGSSPDGSNIFKGWIDDVRLYNVVLSAQDLEVGYGDGYGDFGPTVDVDVALANNSYPIPVVIRFRDHTNALIEVEGFEDNETNETAVVIDGATLQNLVADNNSTYRFELVPDRNPQKIFLTVSAGQEPQLRLVTFLKKSQL